MRWGTTFVPESVVSQGVNENAQHEGRGSAGTVTGVRTVAVSQLARLTGVLPVLRELGEGRTLTDAAKNVGMSQPALSRALSRWEAEVGLPLVEREGRGIILTNQGRQLADAADEALSVFQASLEVVLAGRDARPVRLGALRSISGEIAALVADVEVDVNMSISEGSAGTLLALLDHGDLDAVIVGPRPIGTGYLWTFLRDQPFHLVVPTGHWLEGAKSVELREVAGESFVAMDSNYTTRHFADELCEEAGISPRVSVESDNSHTLRSFVSAGLGLCILPAVMADDLSVRSVPIIRTGGQRAVREIGMVRAARRKLPPHVRKELHRLVNRTSVEWK